MSQLTELAAKHTDLNDDECSHLERLVRTWGVLSDFCFSDIVLYLPIDSSGSSFLIGAHVRPYTGQTLYPTDLTGLRVDELTRAGVVETFRTQQKVESDALAIRGRERTRVECIPVRYHDRCIAVMARESATLTSRRQGTLERAYLEVFDRIAAMIVEGVFPFADAEVEPQDAPRVGDGVVLVDEQARLRFASPNAVSAFHRVGVHAYSMGTRLSQVGFDDSVFDNAFRKKCVLSQEVERGEYTVLVRVIPLLEHGNAAGAVMILRDVTELRVRDRLLLSKDQTIREIHHRVKNNLQTIAALLRLQGRRVTNPDAQAALVQTENRIRSIAVVHETLSRDAEPVVRFNEILKPLVDVVQESLKLPGGGIEFTVVGDGGLLPGEIATPLAVVLNELMQNAVDHAYPSDAGVAIDGHVQIALSRDDDWLQIDVSDDGVGFPEGFSFETGVGLGSSIVHGLVTGELAGTLEIVRDDERPNVSHVRLRVPIELPESTI